MIQYKCKLLGINVLIQEESYTSKASFIDNDKIPVYKKNDKKTYEFSGKRIKRGLYKTKNGLIINADINGSLNIMRKAISNVIFADGIQACSTPVKLYVSK